MVRLSHTDSLRSDNMISKYAFNKSSIKCNWKKENPQKYEEMRKKQRKALKGHEPGNKGEKSEVC